MQCDPNMVTCVWFFYEMIEVVSFLGYLCSPLGWTVSLKKFTSAQNSLETVEVVSLLGYLCSPSGRIVSLEKGYVCPVLVKTDIPYSLDELLFKGHLA